ncbi:cysteine--1-D-myo-inosityl 2-amino-2-deoxy-alpha-D-glucopyranoside ligase [Corynebacterium gerontici]|uniref:L-cysteine:1D-myo-inositol 2-amino-2-deoxy-alpha-D-glucopyranoside ligase n=1 Tax=Corynebacterium gerontici TaxID=2079234 RepID=A0A3G6J0W3_9CORY|nr:cysteine--1-D-myo-inosityl 2-amino-2-deoxy-alpha-D-glucopyranoside ligase [Corynebacterium gerontici]AZA11433.1 L-cysteine:1D-myo-inositol 2-amino-2-deoxy-alpha-D-glucopyranoside ligase [Corynebacterium gerontici]
MHSWSQPELPDFSAISAHVPQLKLYDSADECIKPVDISGNRVGVYVCGITPYDSTHLGHAATYLTFDLAIRQLRAAGHEVEYVQNITDVDDPLFERAERDGVDWRELGTSQIDLFRSDMEALSVIPPQHYVGAMESVDEVVEMVQELLDAGAAYMLDDEYPDIYASIHATKQFGYESNYDRPTMEELFAERGGDPQREGKRDPLDALIWRAARKGEPSWNAPFGPGRPGWHVECSAIATNRLGASFAIQGGGSDLKFPHHEFSAAHAEAAHGVDRMARHYVHAGMIALDGVKMSKSLGNLVFVSKLTQAGHDPSAIRLGVFAGHYRSDRDWSQEVLTHAERRLALWRSAVRGADDERAALAAAEALATALSEDLDTPSALEVVDEWARKQSEPGEGVTRAGAIIADACDALLGVKLKQQ